jgi:hypothetical protein
MKTDLNQFGEFIYAVIKHFGTTERWESLFDLVRKTVTRMSAYYCHQLTLGLNLFDALLLSAIKSTLEFFH